MAFTDFLCLFGKEGRGRTSARRRETGGPALVHKNAVGQCACEKPTGRCECTDPQPFGQNTSLNPNSAQLSSS